MGDNESVNLEFALYGYTNLLIKTYTIFVPLHEVSTGRVFLVITA